MTIWIINGECQACGRLVLEPGADCKCIYEEEEE